MRRKVICIDLCGTLCEETCWTRKQVLNATPRQDIIDKVNSLYKENFIVVYTARRDHLIPSTLFWLRTHGVMYHAFSNNKIGADVYIDDRAIRPEEI